MASNSVPSQFSGSVCPYDANFAYVHGPSPAVATIRVMGNQSPPVGTPGYFTIGPQSFYGFLTNRQYNQKDDLTTLRLVDWRDLLQDRMLFFQLNMQDQDGRFYHILPIEWPIQQRTYVTPELPQWNFPPPGADPLAADPFHAMLVQASGQLLSAELILAGLAAALNFTVHCDQFALQVFRNAFPLNLDGNHGMSAAQLIELVLTKSGLTWTCFGKKDLYVHLRGFTDNAFVQVFTSTVNPCDVGATEGDIGEDLNENGRRIHILGDKNKHEMIFLCRPNWNPIWTWQLAFGGATLSALLEALNLTLDSKLFELPEPFWDTQHWPDAPRANQGFVAAKPIRNSMTIREYIEKYVFKCYIVDFHHVLDEGKVMIKDDWDGRIVETSGINIKNTPGSDPRTDLRDYKSFFPKWTPVDKAGLVAGDFTSLFTFFEPSSQLVSDSNLQFQLYCTSRRIVRGADHPFADQLSMTPKNDGCSLEFEELLLGDAVLAPTVGDEYGTVVRLLFSQPQFWIKPGGQFMDPDFIQPDIMGITLALEAHLYERVQGESFTQPRVREKVISVRNLRKQFLNGKEVQMLAQNFLDIPGTGGARPSYGPGKVDAIADQIAQQYLYHKKITTSGSLTFYDTCGMTPDGVIDSVQVTWHPKDGIREMINFSDENHRDLELVLPTVLRVSFRQDQEEKTLKDRLHAIALASLKDAKRAERTMAVFDKGLHEPGAFYGTPIAALGLAKDGVAAIGVSKTILDAAAIPAGAPIVVGKPKPAAP